MAHTTSPDGVDFPPHGTSAILKPTSGGGAAGEGVALPPTPTTLFFSGTGDVFIF